MDKIINVLKAELTFENLYAYLYKIYLNGAYRNIDMHYIDFNGAKVITIKNGEFGSYDHVSLYEVMNEGSRLEERNCIRYFD